MLYKVGEYHQMKNDFRRAINKNDWVKIVEREKYGRNTFVTIEDRNGILYRNVSVKKLRKKAK